MSAHAAKIAILALFIAGTAVPAAGEDLFQSKPITPRGEYLTPGIEGPAVDAAGTLYVANFDRGLHKRGTIGMLKPGATKSEAFADLPAPAVGNGMRFDREGRLYVADFKTKTVYVFTVDPATGRLRTTPVPYARSTRFNEPNDLAMAEDGTIYASDPKVGRADAGQIWRITRGPDGKGVAELMNADRIMGKTNGIDLSPDGKTLYVSESVKREVWSYRIDGTQLKDKHLVTRFDGPPQSELDGLRTDVDGRLFVARPLNKSIAIITIKPDGTVVVKDIPLNGNNPSNLTFGGPDGKTVFVTQVDGGFIESFRTDRPGREPCLQVPAAC